MKKSRIVFAVATSLLCCSAWADIVPVGYVAYDVTGLNTAEFDIVNQTGPNSSFYPDTTFPISSSLAFTNLSLTVDFASGPPTVYGSSYFTLAPDGISFDGTPFSTINPAVDAILTGTFGSSTATMNDGSTVNIAPSFTATITDSSGSLADQDLALINAVTSPLVTSTTPEPGTWILLLSSALVLLAFRLPGRLRKMSAKIMSVLFVTCGLMLVTSVSASASVHLNVDTSPSSGASGVTFVSATGSGFPSGTIPIGNVSITLASSCAATPNTPAPAIKVTPVVGTSDKIEFQIPASLNTGVYYVTITGTTSTGTAFASSNCSAVAVTHTTKALSSCIPTSSLAVITGTNVISYVPNGAWDASNNGVQVVTVEGTGTAATISTPNAVNSCSSNSQTGETVCTANNTDVYLITGSTLNQTLTSGSTGDAGFSGGSCMNCGVAINALTNQAIIAMGFGGSPANSAIQFLNLATNSFGAPIPTNSEISENIAVDPTRNLLFSPDEQGNYDLFQISASNGLTEYSNNLGGEFDSAAEDCTTGIALSTQEFSQNVLIVDLTQATFVPPVTAGASGTWSAPNASVFFPEFEEFAAGTDGISVAPGTTHLGIVTGEFYGNNFAAFQLPATSGTGTPTFVDYAAAVMPPTPDGCIFSQGLDPHTVTAYTSPNNGKAYGLMATNPPPAWLGVIDLQALMSAPRTPGVDPDGYGCGSCTHSVSTSYDLIAHGVVRYIATGNPAGSCDASVMEEAKSLKLKKDKLEKASRYSQKEAGKSASPVK